jgi:hypothetical protein
MSFLRRFFRSVLGVGRSKRQAILLYVSFAVVIATCTYVDSLQQNGQFIQPFSPRYATPEIIAPESGSVLHGSKFIITGKAEPGSEVVLYKELGKTVASASGDFSYPLNADRNDETSDRVVILSANTKGVNKSLSQPITLKLPQVELSPLASPPSSKELLPSPKSLGKTAYRSAGITRNIDDVVVYDLDTVCSSQNLETEEGMQSSEHYYQASFQGRKVDGSMTFEKCTRGGNFDATGVFVDQDQCEGTIALVIDERNSAGKATAAAVYWKYQVCSRGKDSSSAVVRVAPGEMVDAGIILHP